jgi:hypothetical protein
MRELRENAESLQNLLVSIATGGSDDQREFQKMRQAVLEDTAYKKYAPSFLRTCRDASQFWQFIKQKFPTYAERRQHVWNEFRPLLEAIDGVSAMASDSAVTTTIQKFDSAYVQVQWAKALDRRREDPEGAITIARSLLESVCKNILDKSQISFDENIDLNKLYKLTAEHLKLAPSQHTEQIFKQILGGCFSVVEGLGALRNRVSDAHGQGARPVKPNSRHAELAVNLAGALAAFLCSTHEERQQHSNK